MYDYELCKMKVKIIPFLLRFYCQCEFKKLVSMLSESVRQIVYALGECDID